MKEVSNQILYKATPYYFSKYFFIKREEKITKTLHPVN